MKDVLRELHGCLRGVCMKFQGYFQVSRMFQGSFVLQFCYCMVLIAATLTEGGLLMIPSYLLGVNKCLSRAPEG